ncbi:MAG: hypothetical protein JOY78_08195 [Pseudonocardia sp.]|nr:hypothetical protein [Pseudonocardia sp.]
MTSWSLAEPRRLRCGRCEEIFLIGTDAASGRPIGAVYNTTRLNDPINTGDSCAQQLCDRIDTQVLKYQALGAVRNGPRLWCLTGHMAIGPSVAGGLTVCQMLIMREAQESRRE